MTDKFRTTRLKYYTNFFYENYHSSHHLLRSLKLSSFNKIIASENSYLILFCNYKWLNISHTNLINHLQQKRFLSKEIRKKEYCKFIYVQKHFTTKETCIQIVVMFYWLLTIHNNNTREKTKRICIPLCIYHIFFSLYYTYNCIEENIWNTVFSLLLLFYFTFKCFPYKMDSIECVYFFWILRQSWNFLDSIMLNWQTSCRYIWYTFASNRMMRTLQ